MTLLEVLAGNIAIVTATFTRNGVLIDPTGTVSAYARLDGGAKIDLAPTHASTGTWTMDVDCATPGLLKVFVTATGDGQSAQVGAISVLDPGR